MPTLSGTRGEEIRRPGRRAGTAALRWRSLKEKPHSAVGFGRIGGFRRSVDAPLSHMMELSTGSFWWVPEHGGAIIACYRRGRGSVPVNVGVWRAGDDVPGVDDPQCSNTPEPCDQLG